MCCRQVGFPPQMLKSLSNKTSPSLTRKNKRQTAAGNNQPPTTSTTATSATTSTTSTTTTTTKTRITRARTVNRSGALNKHVLHSILNNIYRLWTVYNDTENTESVDCAGRRVLPYQEVSYDLKTLTFQDPRTLRKMKQKRYISQNKIPCDFLRMILRVAVALLTRKTQCVSVYGTICT